MGVALVVLPGEALPGDALDTEPQPAARSALLARAASDSCAIVLTAEAPDCAAPPNVNRREATAEDS